MCWFEDCYLFILEQLFLIEQTCKQRYLLYYMKLGFAFPLCIMKIVVIEILLQWFLTLIILLVYHLIFSEPQLALLAVSSNSSNYEYEVLNSNHLDELHGAWVILVCSSNYLYYRQEHVKRDHKIDLDNLDGSNFLF